MDWGGPKTIKELNPKMGFPAATDFTTNQVYVVNGYLEPTMVIAAGDPDPGGSVSPNAVPSLTTPLMMRYDGATGTVSSLGSGSGFQIVDNGFAGCWSSSRNSLFLHGGTVGSPVEIYQKTLYEFIPSNPKYTTIADTGAAPSARFGHCMVEAYGGTKMVLFGGVDQTSAALSDIYILDVEKLSWKAGKVGGAGVGRTYAACAVSNDMFVAWGGATRIGNNFVALTSNLTVVYNLKTGEWQSTFSPARVVIPTSTTSGALRPSSSIDEKTDDGSSSSGALMGGIVGGLAAIGAIAGLLVYRRRAARKQQKRDKKMSFSTYSALPVVATRAASSDDSLPGQSARNGKRDKDNEEDDGGGVVYIVEAAATSTSVTPRSLVGSYQQQQQQQANHDPAGGIPVLVPASEVASMASPTSTYAPPIVARPYMPQDRIIKIFEPSITYASPGPALPITSTSSNNLKESRDIINPHHQ
ncbi:hypothetical protein EC991_009460 [Linnemannia zychae]|nr:hypothetical protein EC991_009460 [Linnemannia zychae]